MTTQSPSAKAVVRSSLVQRLARFVSLSSAETEVLEDLQSTTRVVRHNREIITQGRRYGGLLVTIEGISVRYRILRDGRRQVLDIALPGDLIGFPACFFDSAPYSISALTDTVLACIPLPGTRQSVQNATAVGGCDLLVIRLRGSDIHRAPDGCRPAFGTRARCPLPARIAGAISEHRSRRRMFIPDAADPGTAGRRTGAERAACEPHAAAIARRRPGAHRRPPGDCEGRRGTVGAGRLRPIVSRPISTGRTVRRGRWAGRATIGVRPVRVLSR